MYPLRQRSIFSKKCWLLSLLLVLVMVVQIISPISAMSLEGSNGADNGNPAVQQSQSTNNDTSPSAVDGSQDNPGSSPGGSQDNTGTIGTTSGGASGDTTASQGGGNTGGNSVTVPAAVIGQPSQPDADGIIVRFKDGTPKTAAAGVMGAASVSGAGQADAAGQLQLVEAPLGSDLNKTLETIRKDPNVQYAEPNYKLYAQDMTLQPDSVGAASYPNDSPPNDTRFADQWALVETQSVQGWQYGNTLLGGNSAVPVTIAVVDTGADSVHEDLTGRVLTGYNAITGTNNTSDDSHIGHGTHVSGIAAALTNNGKGIAGTSDDFPVSIVPVKVLDSSGIGTLYDVAQGIRKAVEYGCKVINLSLGAALPDYPQTLADAVKYAQDNGCLVVAASGNDGANEQNFYPANLPGVLSVNATGKDHKIASFSNTEGSINAPGVDILSTLPRDGQGNSQYGTLSGTSVAAPFVSAAAAVLWSVFPDKSADEVASALKGGYKSYYGSGYVLSLYEALNKLHQNNQVWDSAGIMSPAGGSTVAGNVNISVKVITSKVITSLVFTLYPNKGDPIVLPALNNPTAESGQFSMAWNTAAVGQDNKPLYPDGKYNLEVVANLKDNNNISSVSSEVSNIIIENQLITGLNLKITKPDEGNPSAEVAASGAQVAVHHIIHVNEQGKDCVYYEQVWTGNADMAGNVIIPAGLALGGGQYLTDGNDYLVSARGTGPDFLYYSMVRAPASKVLSSKDAVRVDFSCMDLDKQPLSGALILADRVGEPVAEDYYSQMDDQRQVPVTKLNGSGGGVAYLTPGTYNFCLLDTKNNYYLVKQNVAVTGTSLSLDFTPQLGETAVIKPVPTDMSDILNTGLVLTDAGNSTGVGFSVVDPDKGVIVTPGVYTADILAALPDKTNSSRYWTWILEPASAFNVGAGDNHSLAFGGSINGSGGRISAVISPLAEMNQDVFRVDGDAWFKASFTDASGNRTIRLYTDDISHMPGGGPGAVSKSCSIIKLALDGKPGSKAPEKAEDISRPSTKIYAYDPSVSVFKAADIGIVDKYPVMTVKNTSDATMLSNNMNYASWYNAWIDVWWIGEPPTGQYKAQASLDAGPLGICSSQWYDFDVEQSQQTTTPTLNIKVTNNSNPVTGVNVYILQQSEGGSETLRNKLNSEGTWTGSDGAAVFSSDQLRDGEIYTALIYNSNSGSHEGLFMPVPFTYHQNNNSLNIEEKQLNLKQVTVTARDAQGEVFSKKLTCDGNLSYYISLVDDTGKSLLRWPLMNYNQNANAVSTAAITDELTFWAPPGRYTIQAFTTKQWRLDYSLYYMKKTVVVTGDSDVYAILGWDQGEEDEAGTPNYTDIALKIPKDAADGSSRYTLCGVSFFDPGDQAAPAFYPYIADSGSSGTAQTMQTIHVSSDTPTINANLVLVRNRFDGEWDYWMEKDIALSKGHTIEWNVSNSFTANLDMVSRTYNAGESITTGNRIISAGGGRLAAMGLNLGMYQAVIRNTSSDSAPAGSSPAQSVPASSSGDLSGQNHMEVAPFLVITDPSGNEVYRHKEAGTNLDRIRQWNPRNNSGTSNGYVLPPREDSTFFSDSYTVPADLPNLKYSARLELGAGPEGMISSNTDDFYVSTTMTVRLDPLASPTNKTSISVSGLTSPGASVTVSYKLGSSGTINTAGPVTADKDGNFKIDNISLAGQGTYEFWAAATLGGQTGPDSTHLTVVADRTPPGPPVKLHAEGLDNTQIKLTWEAPGDSDVLKYQIYRNNGAAPIAEIQAVDVQHYQYTDGGPGVLTVGIDYTYKVYAVDQAGNISTAAVTIGQTDSTVDTTPPSKPAGFNVISLGNGAASLTWNKASDNKDDNPGYNVYRAIKSGSTPPEDSSFTKIASVAGLSYRDAGLLAETTYVYAVEAVDAAGNKSAWSDRKELTTPKLSIYSLTLKAPRKNINGEAYSGDTVTIELFGEPGRFVHADLQYSTWKAEDGSIRSDSQGPRTVHEPPIALHEVAGKPGQYSGSFTLLEGICSVDSIIASESDTNDGSGHVATKTAGQMPLKVTGKLVVSIPAAGTGLSSSEIDTQLENTRLSIRNTSMSSLLNSPGSTEENLLDGLSEGNNYILALTGAYGVNLGSWNNIAVKGGLETELSISPAFPASLDVQALDENGKPIKGICVYLVTDNYSYGGSGVSNDTGWVRRYDTDEPVIKSAASGTKFRLTIDMYNELLMKYKNDSVWTFELKPGLNTETIQLTQEDFNNLERQCSGR